MECLGIPVEMEMGKRPPQIPGARGLSVSCSCASCSLVLWKYREEKSLRHVAMVANVLDDIKPKRHLKSGFALFQT